MQHLIVILSFLIGLAAIIYAAIWFKKGWKDWKRILNDDDYFGE